MHLSLCALKNAHRDSKNKDSQSPLGFGFDTLNKISSLVKCTKEEIIQKILKSKIGETESIYISFPHFLLY